MPSTRNPSPATAAVVEAKAAADASEVAMLVTVIDWAAEHTLTGAEAEGCSFWDTGIPLGGIGCPVVSEFAADELGMLLGRSTDSAFNFIGKTLEVRFRLPKLWERVLALEVPVWRAFKVAELTMILCQEGAAYVDRMLAPTAHVCSFAQIERTVEEAIARFDPAEAERRQKAAQEHRKFDIHTDQVSLEGVVEVNGTLDLADALDLEQAVRAGAALLRESGCEESLDVRRAMAVGDLARGQQGLPLERAVTIYAHLDADSLASNDLAVVENTRSNVLIDQIRSWCGSATKVVVKEVIDLNENLVCDGYEPSEALREQVVLRDPTCVFPYCTRPSRRCDLDHQVPYEQGGTTSSDNLSPLCRRHHRAKTHSGWGYSTSAPGVHEWTSPSGYTFTVRSRRRP